MACMELTHGYMAPLQVLVHISKPGVLQQT